MGLIFVTALVLWFAAACLLNKYAKIFAARGRQKRLFAACYIVSLAIIISGIWHYFYEVRTCVGWGCLFAGLFGALIAIFGSGLLIITAAIHIVQKFRTKN